VSEYSPSDYRFPIVYVESVESDEYLIPNIANNRYKITKKPVENALGKTIYEKALELAIDIENSVTTRGIAVRVPWKGDKAMYVQQNTPVYVYEVGGVQTIFYAYEGDDLKKNDVLAYVLTGKGETRTIRVDHEATVLYIAWIPGTHPPKYVAILVEEENLIILEPEQ